MIQSVPSSEMDLSAVAQEALIEGARDARPVNGLTHNFYRYPARFSPAFVRSAIEVFTTPGETVFDPYMGGGTSIVEAIALGRNAIGVDISQLAEFVTTVKTTLLNESDLDALLAWSKAAAKAINMRGLTVHFAEYEELGYFKHMDHPKRWRLRRAIEQALGTAIGLGSPRLEAFARCAILRTAQWALDSRRVLPTIDEFRNTLVAYTAEMTRGATELSRRISVHDTRPAVSISNMSAADFRGRGRHGFDRPKLVVTSPPYPGIHVLYHRWQVDGRKETAAPFWIANKLDGDGSSHYTMGDRKNPGHRSYFKNLLATTNSIVDMCDPTAVFVQMVAFSNPETQLDQYLATMRDAGLRELLLPALANEGDGRLWRTVPSRRWYAHQRGETASSKEVVLFHQMASSGVMPQPHQHPRPPTLASL